MVSLPFRETLEKKFRFISLCFASKVSLRFVKKYVSLQSFASGTVSLQNFRFVSLNNILPSPISPPTLSVTLLVGTFYSEAGEGGGGVIGVMKTNFIKIFLFRAIINKTSHGY